MISFLLGLINPLGKLLKLVETKVDNETERQRIQAETVQTYVNAQAQVLTGRGWWFPLLFLIPSGVWFASVCLYSVLWCKACAFPQTWTIAALPPPLNDYMALIVGSLFVGKVGEAIISKYRR